MAPPKTPLRTVKPGEAAPEPPPKPKTLTEAVASGTYLEIIEAQRRQIVADLPDEKGPAKAAMHRQLALLSKEIEAMKLKALEDGDDGTSSVEDEAWDEAAL